MLVITALIALAITGTQAIQRNGRTGELRVFNFIDDFGSVASPNVQPFLRDGTTRLNSGNVRVNTVFGTVQNTVLASVAPSQTQTINNFVTIDMEGVNKVLNVTLTQGGLTTLNHQVCQGAGNAQVAPNKRNTLVITSSVSGAVAAPFTCTAAGQQCNSVDLNTAVGGTVQFQCDVFTEEIPNDESCTTDKVNIWRNDPLTCDQFIFRTSTTDVVGLNANEDIRVSPKLNASPSLADPDIRDLDQTQTYEIISTELFTDAGVARRHELFWGPGFFDTNSYKTGFVKVINGNFRTNAAGTALENTYDFTINQGGNNVHFAFSVAPNAQSPAPAADWIELPLGALNSQTFTMNLFRGESATTLFGNRATATAATAVQVGSTFTFTLAANEYAAIVLSGGSVANTATPTVNKVTIQNGASALVDEGAVSYQLFNFINGNKALEFATPDTTCCNFVDFAGGRTLNNGPSASRTVLSSELPTSDTTLNIYESGAACGSLSSALLAANALTLDDDATGATCKRKAQFILGRKVTVTGIAVGSDVGSCATSQCSNNAEIVASVNAVNAGTTSSFTVVEVEVPNQCECAPVVTAPVDLCSVCLADEFDALSATVSSIRASTSGIQAALSSQIDGIDSDVRKAIREIGNVEKDIEDLDSKLDDIEDLGDDIEDEVKNNRRITNNILREVRA